MNLYPLTLKFKVIAKRIAIALHLTHPPHLETFPVVGGLRKGICAWYHGGGDVNSPHSPIIRAAVENAAQLQVVLNIGAKVIALVETCDLSLVRGLCGLIAINPPGIENLVGVELGNEIDLTDTTAKDFGTFVSQGTYLLRTVGGYRGDIISGGVSRVRSDTLTWLREALTGCPTDILVGIHRYSIDNDAAIPQDGYVNRDEECNAVREVANGRGIAITEFGYPLLDDYTPHDLEKVVASVKVDLDFFSRMGSKYAVYYQFVNGPTNTPIDRFGAKPEVLELLA